MKQLFFFFSFVMLVIASPAEAQSTLPTAEASPAIKLVTSPEPGWPQWLGPDRSGVSAEKGLLASWPKSGPKLLWKATGLGKGYSSPVISRGTIYITGDAEEQLFISALDADGKVKWKTPNGKPWVRSFPGSRSSCTYADGLVYHTNAHGRLVCLNANDGKEVWSVSLLEKYASKNILWGICESPVVDDGKIFVTPGGGKALMVALDAKTGKEIWKTKPLNKDETATYTSPLLLATSKGKQLITSCSAMTFGVDAATGKLLWNYPHDIDMCIALTLACSRGKIIVPLASRQDISTFALTLDPQTNQVKRMWGNKMGNATGNPRCVSGKILYPSSRQPRGWHYLDDQTGKVVASLADLRAGASIYADGRFYALCSDGKMLLLAAGEKKLRIVSKFTFIEKKKDVWAYPVLCNGRLYLRYDDTLYCYDVQKKATGPTGK